jgi:uncharacterized protein (UPF0212 family)
MISADKRRAEPTFRSHVRAHEAVVANEFWYGDGHPSLGKTFTAKKTTERHAAVVHILLKAGKRAEKAKDKLLAETYHDLADKLDGCKPSARCGSLACPTCARAFQKAKVAAQETLILRLRNAGTDATANIAANIAANITASATKRLVMANVVPLWMTFAPAQLHQLDIQKRNRWLKDALAREGFDRVMFGSADLSWENGFYQLHWHIGMFASNRKKLKERLKKIFPGKKGQYDRPVLISKTWSLGFLAYKNKAIKLPDLLRRNRKHLAELLLVLDRTEPLDLMVLTKLRLSAQEGHLILRPIENKSQKSLR